MQVADFIIGLTIMNALFHFTLGVWKQRMLSGLGFGNMQNILYGLLNFGITIGLFIYNYGVVAILENGMYLGSLFFFVMMLFTANMWRKFFHKEG
ncbi:MAG: hypothetical protein JKX84_02055 [Flavobacteriales bacterium]|nr:hypothetical protein [Flavobacteriales bacterium]